MAGNRNLIAGVDGPEDMVGVCYGCLPQYSYIPAGLSGESGSVQAFF